MPFDLPSRSAVALTDTVQGFIMIFGSVSVAFCILRNYGGWNTLDPTTYPRPDFFQTPTKKQQWIWWQLGLLGTSFAFYPVTIQRIYAANSLKSIRMGVWANFFGPWLTQISVSPTAADA